MLGDPALCAGDHQILDPHIGKRAARHHPIIAPAAAVAVEIRRRDAAREKVLTRW